MKILFIIVLASFNNLLAFTQSVSINEDASAPHASAMLDIKSSSKGLLIPRMSSAKRTGVANAAPGLLVYDNETESFWYYKTAGWTELTSGGAAGTNFWDADGTNIYNNNSGNVGIGLNNPLAPLHIKSGSEALRIQGITPYVSFTDDNGAIKGFLQSFDQDLFLGTPTANTTGKLQFYVTNTPALIVKPTTDVIIGSDASNSFGKLSVQTLNNSNGISHLGEGGNILATRMGGTSAGIGTFSPTNMRIFAGSFSRMFISEATGNVGIGTDNPTSKLSVVGNVRAYEVVVENNWADYVFDKKYKLPSLSEVEKYIEEHKHLPNIPSAADITKNGLNLGDTQKKMMEKIEELTLYMIEANKKIESLEQIVRGNK